MGALVITWGDPIAGREKEAVATFDKAREYAERLAKDGELETTRVFSPVIGHRTSMVQILEGHPDRLATLPADPEFREILTAGRMVTDEVGVELWDGGGPDTVQEESDRITQVGKNLGYL